MNTKDQIETARDSLSRILGFFPRVDTLLSVILAINLGLIAVLASNAPAVRSLDGYAFFALVFVLVCAVSFYHLYKCAFPRLEGGHTSLIYFREIAGKSELSYRQEFGAMTDIQYLDDLTEQVWRNSKILTDKFHHARWAFVFMLISLVPWLPALTIFVSKNTDKLLAR